MSPYLFLLVLTLLAVHFVNGQENFERDLCEGANKTLVGNIQDKICCQGNEYAYPRYLKHQFIEACNVEPKTENLSFQDSVWLAYDCHVRTWLNGTELTKESFVTWISQLPQSQQSKFWSVLSSDNKITLEIDEVERMKISKIKSYFFQYLETVLKICSSELENGESDTEISEETIIWGNLSVGLENCSSGPLPEFLIQPKIGVYEPFEICKSKFVNVLGYSTYWKHFGKMFLFCKFVAKNISMNELEKGNLDFQTVLYDLMPKFWSKSLKNITMEEVLDKISFGVNSNTTKNDELIQKFWGRIDKELANFQSGNLTSGTNVTQIIRNVYFGAGIYKFLSTEEVKMCSVTT